MIYGFGFFKVNYLKFSLKFVVVKIILINYAKKTKNLFMPGLVGKHKMDKLERICSDWTRKSL
jgi:hypothetical protein